MRRVLDKSETPELRWFDYTLDQKCQRCGKRACGVLRGSRNESYGPHCNRCATIRLRNSKALRDAANA